jgi:hypothetical protein
MNNSKTIVVSMSSNSETFPLADALTWTKASLENCNLVSTNGDPGQPYVIHIEQMTVPVYFCKAGKVNNRTGSFLVSAQPFNPQENKTVFNKAPHDELNELEITINNPDGSLATIESAFSLSLRID